MLATHHPVPNSLLFPREVFSQIEKAYIEGRALSVDHPIDAAYAHHFQQDGGCTRMNLTLECSAALGLNQTTAIALAASVECLHNASIIQDDLQDNSHTRRGQITVARKFGPDVALGLTNRLVSAAFVCVAIDSLNPFINLLIRQLHLAISETIDGQTHELLGINGKDSLDQRLNAAMKKSGPLFALAIELPLITAGFNDHIDTAHQSALQFGLGYQIIDDLQDQASDASVGSNVNFVSAMSTDYTGDTHAAEQKSARIASNAMEKAAILALQLPMHAGLPLIHLINRQRSKLAYYEP